MQESSTYKCNECKFASGADGVDTLSAMDEQATGLRERKKRQHERRSCGPGSSCSSSAATTRRRSPRSRRPPGLDRGRSLPTSRARKTSSSRRSTRMCGSLCRALDGAGRPASMRSARCASSSSRPPREDRSWTAGSASRSPPTRRSRATGVRGSGRCREVLANAIATDLGAGSDDRRPQIAAASLTAAFELLDSAYTGRVDAADA